jgi:hypothetical protein
MVKTVLIVGNTYPVKDQIKALGGRWNAQARGWDVPETTAEAARKLVIPAVAGTTKPTSTRVVRTFRPCGYPGCNPNYCDECDGEGYRGYNPRRHY